MTKAKIFICTNTSCEKSDTEGRCSNQITSAKFSGLSEDELKKDKYIKREIKPELMGGLKYGKLLCCLFYTTYIEEEE